MEKRQYVEKQIRGMEEKLERLIEAEKWDAALQLLSLLARIMYTYNQWYTDEFLESKLTILQSRLKIEPDKEVWREPDERTILFYDGFGSDTRGLALIYLDALCRLGYRVLYMAPAAVKGQIPTIQKVLEEGHGLIEYMSDAVTVKTLRENMEIIEKYHPSQAFFYGKPWHPVDMLLFGALRGKMTSYLINLTDHAFWLGVNEFDYYLEFRDYGASISANFRGIPEAQLLCQPYYPVIKKDEAFKGFPFEKKDEDFVVFSGGSPYKISDRECTFSQLVEEMLQKHPQVKFWYAGEGACPQMEALVKKYPQRAFYTSERSDLFDLLRHVDLYLNTYPIAGALMMQYAAVAGRVPVTYAHDPEISGILIGQDDLGIIFPTRETFREELDRLIEDADYRKKKEERLGKAVMTREEFIENLQKILTEKKSVYPIHIEDIDTSDFRRTYEEEFGWGEIARQTATKQLPLMLRHLPRLYLEGAMIKIKEKIRRKL